MKKVLKYASILSLGGLLAACNGFLDKEPDNRATVDNLDKVSALLVSAYPNRTNMSILDPRCDYIRDFGACVDGSQPASNFDYVAGGFMWDQYTPESSNDTHEQYWTSVYEAVSAANHALASIEAMPASEQAKADKQRAEALMTRAYNHFTLLTVFANLFDPKFPDVSGNTNLGIPYVTEPEDVVIKFYERGTVTGTLEKVKTDFNLALKSIGGAGDYAQPKYHFTKDASYAFGARLALYTGDYAGVIAYAASLGIPNASKLKEMTDSEGNPVKNADGTSALYVDQTDAANMYCQSNMTNWNEITNEGSLDGMAMAFSGASSKDNLLVSECVTSVRRAVLGTRYTRYGMDREIIRGMMYGSASGAFLLQPAFGLSGDEAYIIPKFYEDFKMDNVQAGTGVAYSKIPLLRRTEVLLARAEAYALTGNYQNALNDLNMWTALHADAELYVYGTNVIYKDRLIQFYASALANKDHFINSQYNAPKFTASGDELRFQKALVLAVLDARKVEFLREGVRYFDILRWFIPYYHVTADDRRSQLTPTDDRRVIQLPQVVSLSGIESNPWSNVGAWY